MHVNSHIPVISVSLVGLVMHHNHSCVHRCVKILKAALLPVSTSPQAVTKDLSSSAKIYISAVECF